MSQETIFLTETLCTVTSAFFWVQSVLFQTMSAYIPLELQFNADQTFLRNYGLKMYGLRDTGDQSPQ